MVRTGGGRGGGVGLARRTYGAGEVPCMRVQMSCILRAFGKDFDVDAFIATSTLLVDTLWRKGERRFPMSLTNVALNETSGLRLLASNAEFSELSKQIDESIVYLRTNHDALKSLGFAAGVDGAVLDFGAEIYPPGWSSFIFPPALLSLAGSANVSLGLSVYPTDDEEDTDEDG
jgi:hypothetical protein